MTIQEQRQAAINVCLKEGIPQALIDKHFVEDEMDCAIEVQGSIIDAVLEHGLWYDVSDRLIDEVYGAGTMNFPMGAGIKGMTPEEEIQEVQE